MGVATDKGAEEDFRALFAAHRDDVLRYVLRRASADLADDVVSEVFLVAWRRLADVPATPLPWLYGVARKVLANQRRSAERVTQLSQRAARLSQVGGDRGTSDGLEAGVISSATFVAAFDRLTDDDREVIALVAWEGLGAREVALVLGCSAPAVAMRLQRARRRLRVYLQIENEGN